MASRLPEEGGGNLRLVIVSDLHVGSEAGLTPFPSNKTQGQLYNRWVDCIEHFGQRPDMLICNGDSTDGTQEKGASSADSDHIAGQIDGAATLLTMWRPKRCCIVAGTHYHTSAARGRVDFEELLAMRLRASGIPETTFHRKLNLTVCGWFRLQCRHKIGASAVPQGRFTSPNRSRMWGIVGAYAAAGKAPHLSVFSHVHYWGYSEDSISATMTTPGWQAIGSDYGDRSCDGRIDVGAVQIIVGKTESEGWSWEKRLYPAAAADRAVSL